jgi:thiamine-phosphate pyrophosphorylase
MPESVASYLRLYLILETSFLCIPLSDFTEQVIEGGVTAIQLRDKNRCEKERYETAIILKKLIRCRDVLFIINDSADIALMANANGVHLGVNDIPVQAVKKRWPKLILGCSCNDEEDAETSKYVDYVGIGPVFPTSTKANHRTILFPAGIKKLAAKVPKPAVAIGGINAETLPQLFDCGIAGIAVSSALCASEEPYNTAKELTGLLEKI